MRTSFVLAGLALLGACGDNKNAPAGADAERRSSLDHTWAVAAQMHGLPSSGGWPT